MCDEDSLEKLVRMGSPLNPVIHQHCHAFSQAQLDMLFMQSMCRLVLEIVYIHPDRPYAGLKTTGAADCPRVSAHGGYGHVT